MDRKEIGGWVAIFLPEVFGDAKLLALDAGGVSAPANDNWSKYGRQEEG